MLSDEIIKLRSHMHEYENERQKYLLSRIFNNLYIYFCSYVILVWLLTIGLCIIHEHKYEYEHE